jgi:hypothetical protein
MFGVMTGPEMRRPTGFDTSYSVRKLVEVRGDELPPIRIESPLRGAGFGDRVVSGVGRYLHVRRV